MLTNHLLLEQCFSKILIWYSTLALHLYFIKIYDALKIHFKTSDYKKVSVACVLLYRFIDTLLQCLYLSEMTRAHFRALHRMIYNSPPIRNVINSHDWFPALEWQAWLYWPKDAHG